MYTHSGSIQQSFKCKILPGDDIFPTKRNKSICFPTNTVYAEMPFPSVRESQFSSDGILLFRNIICYTSIPTGNEQALNRILNLHAFQFQMPKAGTTLKVSTLPILYILRNCIHRRLQKSLLSIMFWIYRRLCKKCWCNLSLGIGAAHKSKSQWYGQHTSASECPNSSIYTNFILCHSSRLVTSWKINPNPNLLPSLVTSSNSIDSSPPSKYSL